MDPNAPSPTAAPLRVAFQGIHGAYSESALCDFYAHHRNLDPVSPISPISSINASPVLTSTTPTSPSSPHPPTPRGSVLAVPYAHFDELFDALESGQADRGFVPVENTHSGSFPEINHLLRQRAVHITAEYVVKERHCLIGHEGVELSQLTEIRSHPAVLDQCRSYLRTLLALHPHISLVQSTDTAAAAHAAATHPSRTVAALASLSAARIHNLALLVATPLHPSNITTRYYEVSPVPLPVPPRHLAPKTVLAITLKNSPGTLFKALSCFALRDLNVGKIESRPQGGAQYPWELVFYLTVDASLNEASLKRALDNLEEYVTGCKVLGCFASWTQKAGEGVSRPYGL
ncbi:Prephenate dehydratase-domain-containing protein [Catenaria anguillulae PL171]|uniref:prephenate dehydratase n=1 Tax=Catenaria anguillulae PL171 TaxID=765915 RepID=A0A1Y2HEW6_9FUNG|nr:Prephenate dehydratase-domain-containing protein [Catenaria anguillulae PL171]